MNDHLQFSESSTNLTIVLNELLRPVYTCSTVESITEWTCKELQQKSFAEILHPDDLESGKDLATDVLNSPGKECSINIRVKKKSGNYIRMKGTAVNLLNSDIKSIIITLFDISRMIEKENILEKNINRFQRAQRMAKMGSWEFDFHSGMSTWSEERCLIFGISTENTCHSIESWLSFVHPDDKEYVLSEIKLSRKLLRRFTLNYRIILNDGTIKHLRSETNYEFGTNGEILGMFGIEYDLTDVLKAQNDLIISETKLKEAQALAHVGNWELDLDTLITTWSEENCKIYGVPVEENKHDYASWLNFIHPLDRERVKTDFENAYANLGKCRVQHRILLDDGSIKHILTESQFDISTDGKPLRMYGIAQDLTEIIETKNKLMMSETRMKEAQALANVGHWDRNFETGVGFWSDECLCIYGIGRNDLIQDPDFWKIFIHPDDYDYVMSENRKAHQHYDDLSITYRLIPAGKGTKWIHLESRYDFDSEGNITGQHGIIHDITDIKEAEEKTKYQNQMLRDISMMQSHQVRAPIANILGLINLVNLDKVGTNLDKEILDNLKIAAEKLDHIIKDIVAKTNEVELMNGHICNIEQYRMANAVLHAAVH